MGFLSLRSLYSNWQAHWFLHVIGWTSSQFIRLISGEICWSYQGRQIKEAVDVGDLSGEKIGAVILRIQVQIGIL
jgi:hypothetical protein